jgi:hypothetical protein
MRSRLQLPDSFEVLSRAKIPCEGSSGYIPGSFCVFIADTQNLAGKALGPVSIGRAVERCVDWVVWIHRLGR